jgi:hypothetical protein
LNEKRKLINKCAYFLIKKLVMFLSFSVIFPSCTDKCLVLRNSIIIPLTSVFYFVFSSYTNKCLVIRISGIVIPKSLILFWRTKRSTDRKTWNSHRFIYVKMINSDFYYLILLCILKYFINLEITFWNFLIADFFGLKSFW